MRIMATIRITAPTVTNTETMIHVSLRFLLWSTTACGDVHVWRGEGEGYSVWVCVCVEGKGEGEGYSVCCGREGEGYSVC